MLLPHRITPWTPTSPLLPLTLTSIEISISLDRPLSGTSAHCPFGKRHVAPFISSAVEWAWGGVFAVSGIAYWYSQASAPDIMR